MNLFELINDLNFSIKLILTTVLLFITYLISYRWKYRYFYKMAEKIPGPKGWPFIGNTLMFKGDNHDIFKATQKLTSSYQDQFSRVWLGPNIFVTIAKPEHLQILLTNQMSLERGQLAKKIGLPYLKNSLLLASLNIWKKKRKLINLTFSQKILDSFMPIFAEKAKILTECLENEVDKPAFDISMYINRASFDAICATAMGFDMNSQINKDSKFLEATIGNLTIISARFFKAWLQFDLLYWLSSEYRIQKKYLKIINDISSSVIKQKKEEFEQRRLERRMSEFNPDIGFGKNAKRKVFLDFLIELNDGDFTEIDLRNEVNLFISAGFDTTATTLCFVLLSLAFYPEIQEKCYEEIFSIFGDSDRDPTIGDLERLTYLDRVIKESLRVFNTVPIIIREINEDLKIDEYIIPKGAHAVAWFYGLHHDTKIWPNPEKFDPDRFLPENVAKRHPFSYMPFSGGPKNCIGYKYALMSLKTILSTLLRKFKFTTPLKKEDLKMSMEITMKMKNGFLFNIYSR